MGPQPGFGIGSGLLPESPIVEILTLRSPAYALTLGRPLAL